MWRLLGGGTASVPGCLSKYGNRPDHISLISKYKILITDVGKQDVLLIKDEIGCRKNKTSVGER